MALTGNSPLRWQRRLYAQMMRSRLLKSYDLPGGRLGKTSVIPLWLIALASQAERGSVELPRRLVYIVNHRAVVDQATGMVEQMRARLLNPEDPGWRGHARTLNRLAGILRGMSAVSDDTPLAISTLRGELADNEEWKTDPARPAIVIGTADTIGSKLLFSGYGDGRYNRPHHAALLGQDALLIHDAAPPMPAFSRLLHRIARIQEQEGEQGVRRPLRTIELRQLPHPGPQGDNPFVPKPEDERDDEVRGWLDAPKRLHLHVAGKTGLTKKLVELSQAHEREQARTLIYVRTPGDARDIADQLRKKLDEAEGRVAILSGTIRGHERDRMVEEDPVYRALMCPGSQVERTVYLVSTPAGEVGIDLDADHLLCDLTTLDSMIQRLERVNRGGARGRRCPARVDVVAKPGTGASSHIDRARGATLDILKTWTDDSREGALDVSPRNLIGLLNGLDRDKWSRATPHEPPVPPLDDILLDAWALTSITKQMPGRPVPATYVYGLTNAPPTTSIAWREEVATLHEARADKDTLRDWFRACRIETHERLRNRTDRVKKFLASLLKRHRKRNKTFPLVLIDERGNASWADTSKLTKHPDLEHRTIVLPPGAGGLSNGMLDARARGAAPDVARHERWLLTAEGYERLVTGEAAKTPPAHLHEQMRIALQPPTGEKEDEDGSSRYLLCMARPDQPPPGSPEKHPTYQSLHHHRRRVAKHVERIASALELPAQFRDALLQAAHHHDRGKGRETWQHFARNHPQNTPLAKSTSYRRPRFLGGQRHEFASLLDAADQPQVQAHDEADLILHLIAAHHGWARPHFTPEAQDMEKSDVINEQAAAEVMQRFASLQLRFGRWGLAWLESLLRCADIAASKEGPR